MLEGRAEIQASSQPHRGAHAGAKRGHKDTELHGTCSEQKIRPCAAAKTYKVGVCVSLSEKKKSHNKGQGVQTSTQFNQKSDSSIAKFYCCNLHSEMTDQNF